LRWASAVSALARKGVGELQPIKLAGHSSLQSVKPYLQLYSDHDQKLTKSLRGNQYRQQLRLQLLSQPEKITTIQANSFTYNNCTFNNYNNKLVVDSNVQFY
jgi:hypothetical protein